MKHHRKALLLWGAALALSACGCGEVQPGSESREESALSHQLVEVRWEDRAVTYRLNGSPAAESLAEQLPLTVEMEDFSTNEKIFYPPQPLDTEHTPTARGGAGTLAYYQPWGDVVLFYGDYRENPSLFELGQAVSGGELVEEITGTVTIAAAETESQ